MPLLRGRGWSSVSVATAAILSGVPRKLCILPSGARPALALGTISWGGFIRGQGRREIAHLAANMPDVPTRSPDKRTMRLSQYPINTMKETPAEAEVLSHQLMLRAGLIRRLAAGLYSWLPMGMRSLHKVE